MCLRQTALTAAMFSIETGCPPPELLVTVSITSGMRSRPTRCDQTLQRRDIHISFEGMDQAGLLAFGDEQVHGLGADKLNVGAGGVEMRVVGNDIALLAHHAEQNALGGAALVGGDDMLVSEDVLNGIAEAVEAAAAGVAFVALHDRGPLVGGHGAGAGIGKQVDQHIVGGEQKQVVVRGPQQLLAFFARGPADGLNTLNAEWLDDGPGHAASFLRSEIKSPAVSRVLRKGGNSWRRCAPACPRQRAGLRWRASPS